MSSLALPRRRFTFGLASLIVCAPAVVRAASLMKVSKFDAVAAASSPWATAEEALAWVQHEMERRFAESLFGEEGLSSDDEGPARAGGPVVAAPKITTLWELRTQFGPRIVTGSSRVGAWKRRSSGLSPKPFEALPEEVRAGMFSVLGKSPDPTAGQRERLDPDFRSAAESS